MRDFFSLVTFSHTVFALPFAMLGYTLGVLSVDNGFAWLDLLLVIACMVTARNAAMAFNRLIDAQLDARNIRTSDRDIPAGRITPRAAAVFVVINSLAFIIFSGMLNGLCLVLSPLALAVILGYSYTKRFTWLCHLILGVGLALAPIGAYVAVTGTFAILPILLGAVVLCWVAGFDIVYALQDRSFDTSQGLQSIPSSFGVKRAIQISRFLHTLTFAGLVGVAYLLATQFPNALIFTLIATVLFALGLVYQHRIVAAYKLSRIDRAFFTTNGIASLLYASVLILGLVLNT